MRFDRRHENSTFAGDGRLSAHRGFLILVLAATVLPLMFTSGCSGIVSGSNAQTQQAPQTFTISGIISPVAGGSGATVALGGAASATVTADGSGNFAFTGLANGIYTVTPTHAGYTFSPASLNVTVNNANVTSGVTFTATATTTSFSISGTISPVTGGAGATVTLSGVAAATTTANASGNYSFSGLANGVYAVTPSHAGYAFNPTSTSATVNGANVTGINFAATATSPTFGISGTLSPTAGGAGATLTLSGAAAATTTADTSGNYAFSGLVNGAYTVTPTNAGYTFTPASQNVTVNSANITGVNFSATAQSFTVALSWTASTSTVSGYNVYRSTTSGTGYAKVNTSLLTTLTYTDSAVVNGTTYYYVATAVDASGNESVNSNEASAVIP